MPYIHCTQQWLSPLEYQNSDRTQIVSKPKNLSRDALIQYHQEAPAYFYCFIACPHAYSMGNRKPPPSNVSRTPKQKEFSLQVPPLVDMYFRSAMLVSSPPMYRTDCMRQWCRFQSMVWHREPQSFQTIGSTLRRGMLSLSEPFAAQYIYVVHH